MISESDRIEKIMPADAASGLYLFLQESESAYTKGLVFRLRIRLGRSYPKEEFERRICILTARHPVLRSVFVQDEKGISWQVFYRGMDVPVWYRDLCRISEKAREGYLSGFFQVMNENQSPFQAACFLTGENSCELLLRLTHTHVDGMSVRLLINELAADADPDKKDAFYEYREKRLASRVIFPAELKEYYASFGERMRLPSVSYKNMQKVIRQEILLTREETAILKQYCGNLGISFSAYVQYCFGRGLLAAMGRKEVWFSQLFSGRDVPCCHESSTLGNLFYTMPVYLEEGMTVQNFTDGLMKPWKYPYVTDTPEYQRLNRHTIENGLISRMFPPFHKNVISCIDEEGEGNIGHYMEQKDGKLKIIFRYYEDAYQISSYKKIEDVMSRLLR